MPKLNPKIRREMMIVAALRLASKPGGWMALTHEAIAKEAHCSYGLVHFHLGGISSVRSKLVKAAIKQENFDVLIQALTAGDPEAQKMRPLLRAKAFAHVAGA